MKSNLKTTDPEMQRLRRRWFEQGYKAHQTILSQEVTRLLKLLEGEQSLYSKGQADGIRWLHQSMQEVLTQTGE